MNKRASYAFRILAGAYLVYLGYSLAKGYLVEHQVSVGFLVIGVVFVALGLFFCITGLQGRRQADKELTEAQAEYENQPDFEEKAFLEDSRQESMEEEQKRNTLEKQAEEEEEEKV